jgi:hypothetical protein
MKTAYAANLWGELLREAGQDPNKNPPQRELTAGDGFNAFVR